MVPWVLPAEQSWSYYPVSLDLSIHGMIRPTILLRAVHQLLNC